MADFLRQAFVGGLLATFFIAMFLLFLTDIDTNYEAVDLDTSNLSSLNRLNDFSDNLAEVREQTVEDVDVSTLDSIASFFNQAFTVGKFIITGGPLFLITDLITDSLGFLGVPTIIGQLLIGLVTVFLVFAVINRLQGRGD